MSDDLRDVAPSVAKDIYLQQRWDDLSDATRQTHGYRIQAFVDWLDEQGITSMAEVDGLTIHNYRVDRRENDDLKKVSLQGQISTIRQFLRVLASVEAADAEVAEKILLPTVRKGEDVNEELLETARARTLLEYLDRYQYASREHVELLLMWRLSARRGGIRALDLRDFDDDDETPVLKFRHRPESDTPLKNGKWSERDCLVKSEKLAQVLRDYIDGPRRRTFDDYDRAPLLTTQYGRVALGTIKQDMYRITRPCKYGVECPHDHDPEECDAARHDGASTCPSSRSPHKIRTGSLTAHLDAGTPKAVLSDRADATEDTLDRHYDQASKREQMLRRKDFIAEDL
ncbi:site-specific integrase [Halobellus rufus]|uniref:site-specific integrase n=1 Tax=Halobellus rufus TaxID=1448860 RepID=UPI00067936B7|nr:site-specific integrase [Halobellus rufus]